MSQQQKDGKWKPVAFLSRTMTPAECNYEIYDKELLAIMECLEKWRQYLLDAEEKFEVWTDHENLKYYREPQDSRHSTSIMDAIPGKEMKIGQLPYPKYKSSHKNLINLGGKPNKP